MDAKVREFIESVTSQLSDLQYIRPEEIPDIPLYMDQVTTFIDDQLSSSRRHSEDKTLTKTMINNYTKNDLLPPPDRKKYSKEHMLLLIIIYYLKNFLSISDIRSILAPLEEKYFGNKEGRNIEDVYSEVFRLEKAETAALVKDLAKKFMEAQKSFDDYPAEDQEFLHSFSFICMLSYDVYIKKMIIENMIDEMLEDK